MTYRVSTAFKWLYCIALLGATLPVGLASSGWVRATFGGGLLGMMPFTGTLLLLVAGLYRVFLVARVSGTLDSPRMAGAKAVLRAIGVFCIYVGAVVSIVNWVSRPLMRMLVTRPSETGVEFYVVGLYLALAGGVGALGLFLFEFSRLISFEQLAREARLK